MKTMQFIMGVLLSGIFIMACSPKDRYLDLSSGEYIEIEKEARTGAVINKITGEPLYIYVDTRTDDTIYAKTGNVINGHVVVKNDKYYFDDDVKIKFDDDGSFKRKGDDSKVKVDDDGDYKRKDENKKIKIDGETGEKKVKYDD